MSRDLSSHFQEFMEKKSIRRKPPPRLDPIATDESYDVLPPLKSAPAASQDLTQSGLSVRTCVVQFGNGDTEDNHYSSSPEDPLVSFESPRPMGPKELPDYDIDVKEDVTPLRRKRSDPAKLPYPTSDDLLHHIDGTPPYPVDDLHFSESDESDVFLTPTKSKHTLEEKPRLSARNSMPVMTRNSQGVTPTRPGPKIVGASDDFLHTYSSGAQASSPGSSHSVYTNGPSSRNGKYSRSPSPRKSFKRSPSLIYENGYQNGNGENMENSGYHRYSYESDYDIDDAHLEGYNAFRTRSRSPESPSKWSLVGGSDSDRSSSIGVFSHEDEAQETPIATYFDYSTLPEIPSHKNFHSGLGIDVRGDKHLTSSLSINKRKDGKLPPVPLELPDLPFSSSSLTSQHFLMCDKIWSLKSHFNWSILLKSWFGNQPLTKKELKKSLLKLIVFHRPDLPFDQIGSNVEQIIESFQHPDTTVTNGNDNDKEQKRNLKDKEFVFKKDDVSGVLPDLIACYCRDKDHAIAASEVKLRCYSSQCCMNQMINHELRLRNTNIKDIRLEEDWASHWKLTATDLRKIDKSLSKRQSLIFDLLRYEQTFISRAQCFVDLVGPEFIKAAKSLVPSSDVKRLDHFESEILSSASELLRIHKEILFEPLLKILITDGKFIKDIETISETYYEWARAARIPLLQYMSVMPTIEELLKNDTMKRWMDINVRNMEKVKELKVNGNLLFLSTFNSRYQSLPLQLSDIRNMCDENDTEYLALSKSLNEIKSVGSKVNEMKQYADNSHSLRVIENQLIWKNNVNVPNLNLSSENRRFVFRGNLTRKSDLKINSYTNHLILLDNFLFITEKSKNKAGTYNYKVIEDPIPIEFLIVEEKEATSDLLPMTKSLTVSTSPIAQTHDDNDPDPSSYPFKIRYAGRGKHHTFTFSTKSEKERRQWIDHFSSAKSRLSLRLKKSEYFNLDPFATTSFGYELQNRVTKLQVCPPFDPIEAPSSDALDKLKKINYGGDLYNIPDSKNKIVFSKVLSAVTFKFRGTTFDLMGLASGVYCTDDSNNWKKVINGSEIAKMDIDTEVNLLVILGNKNLRYCSLDSIVSMYYERSKVVSCVSVLADNVSFFELARYKDINMLFCAKRKGGTSTSTVFWVFIPETDNDGIFHTLKTVKSFSIQADCSGISVFNSSFCLHTSKGFEIMDMEKLIPRSIPDTSSFERKVDGYNRKLHSGSSNSDQDYIKKHLNSVSVKPMGMFKLNNGMEFLLMYNDCALFVNRYGKLSRKSMLRFNFKIKSVAFSRNILFLVCDEVLEIWSISDYANGSNRLVQVILGKEINLVSPAEYSGPLIVSMANPKVQGLQLVLRLKRKSGVPR